MTNTTPTNSSSKVDDNPNDSWEVEIDKAFAFGYEDPAFINDIHVLIGGKSKVDEAKTAIKAATLRQIGEDEPVHGISGYIDFAAEIRNKLRAEQRAKLAIQDMKDNLEGDK